MAKSARTTTKSVYQLKVTLDEIHPLVWRCIQVPGETKLPDFHLMLQAAMGWSNCHLHKFTIDGIEYSVPDPDWDDLDAEDEKRVRLSRVVPRAGSRFSYMYDFGDGWEHDIVVEEILPPARGVKYPICLAGKRRCPPEDVGGPWGYREFLAALADPNHEGHAEYLEWIGGEFDADEFDVDAVNGLLKDYRLLDPWNS